MEVHLQRNSEDQKNGPIFNHSRRGSVEKSFIVTRWSQIRCSMFEESMHKGISNNNHLLFRQGCDQKNVVCHRADKHFKRLGVASMPKDDYVGIRLIECHDRLQNMSQNDNVGLIWLPTALHFIEFFLCRKAGVSTSIELSSENVIGDCQVSVWKLSVIDRRKNLVCWNFKYVVVQIIVSVVAHHSCWQAAVKRVNKDKFVFAQGVVCDFDVKIGQ